jgi:hypothetical protein
VRINAALSVVATHDTARSRVADREGVHVHTSKSRGSYSSGGAASSAALFPELAAILALAPLIRGGTFTGRVCAQGLPIWTGWRCGRVEISTSHACAASLEG